MPGIDPAVPVIIVLGGRIVHTRVGFVPSGSLKRRLARALAEYRYARSRGAHPALICSGGRASPGVPSEAQVMASWLAARAVPRSALLVESHSRTTEENMGDCAALLRGRTPIPGLLPDGTIAAVIVTSWQHVPRARYFAVKYRFTPVMRGASLAPSTTPKALIWELGAVGIYLARVLARRVRKRRRRST
ncbi:YdcF family protein [Actinotignum sanguinis]|uniref:YdcF family protein n=2 Tax=Actinomycetaceae TaxID=2049 RepID=A0ABZ0RCX5_9ACTO|nr:YdcF family protein [Actinotignum sanguinis]WPJ88832.1 YdcF family protein [Schaalia turicensis]MDE1553411.1 YdcF family protein [Actinotignum sanguinis]MDE1656455.1 YdcF family protein [Actinotignum sanguinis]MDK7197176.1 YdcF family protein [Actinotignum sanguinis]MDK8512495.1 YdcF family protein [Actinotignum sanguinis]